MASFCGQNICNSFSSILNIGAETDIGCCLPDDNSSIIVTDALGNASSVSIARATGGLSITGNANIASGNITLDGNITTPGNITAGTTSGAIAATTITSSDIATLDSLEVTNNACVIGDLTVDGIIRGGADIIAFSTSDKRLKENVNKIVDSKDVINSITGYSFDWKEEANREGKDFGVIAQEVEEVLPELVQSRPDGFKAVDYIKLIPYLIEEVKRLNNEIEQLKGIV